jgi:hypothetical protein
MKKIIERMDSSTPVYFRKLRNIGLVVGAAGATILASPVALPAIVIKIAGYLVVAGTVAGAVAQTAVTGEEQ